MVSGLASRSDRHAGWGHIGLDGSSSYSRPASRTLKDEDMRNIVNKLFLSAALLGASASVLAGPVALNGNGDWYNFNVIDGSGAWLSDAFTPLEFSYSSSTSFTLRITDFLSAGEFTGFRVNGSYFGATNVVAEDYSELAFTPDEAFGRALWSQGSWQFGPGSYVFSGDFGRAPTGQGVMAISVQGGNAVPEPSALSLLALAGLAAVCARSRRHKVES